MTAFSLLISFALVAALMTLPRPADAQEVYEGFYNYLGNYPSFADDTGWHEKTQGLAHDQENWFIAQNPKAGLEPRNPRVWKVPVAQDIRRVSGGDPGVVVVAVRDVPELLAEDFDHAGDIDHYEHEGNGYVLVPLEVEDGNTAAISVLDAETLAYVDHALLPVGRVGWCAVGPDGALYTTNTAPTRDVSYVDKFTVDWEAMTTRRELIFTERLSVPLYDEAGGPVSLAFLQGGAVSPGGELLYLSMGWNLPRESDGIQVFDLSTGRRVQRSTNGNGYFDFEFQDQGDFGQEPEGMTIWDLDDGRAPGVRGQLHIILLDKDFPSDDQVWVKHYTNAIYVNGSHTGESSGKPWSPFRTVGDAAALAWDGAVIDIQAGNYPEAVTIHKRVKVRASSGPAIIGE